MFLFLFISHYILILNGVSLYGSSLFIHFSARDDLMFSSFCYVIKPLRTFVCMFLMHTFSSLVDNEISGLYSMCREVIRNCEFSRGDVL